MSKSLDFDEQDGDRYNFELSFRIGKIDNNINFTLEKRRYESSMFFLMQLDQETFKTAGCYGHWGC